MEKIKWKRVILIILFIVTCELLYILFLKYNYDNEIKLHLSEETKKVDMKVKYALNIYDTVSETIFTQIINKPDILEIFSKAHRADNNEKTAIRKELHLKLFETYKHLTELNIRQLHFHLPDNESFLRFHSPSKFGDNLTKDRYSVRMTNRDKKIYKGFEEGKIYNGFRYVFPLIYKNEHIGSVETSFSIKSIKKQLEALGIKETRFILKKELVLETVFRENQNFYEKTLISDNYVIEKDENENIDLDKNKINKIDLKIKNNVEKLLKKNENFSIYTKSDNEYYIVSFIIVKSVEGLNSAYIIVYQSDKTINNFLKWLTSALISGLIIIPFIVILIFLYIEEGKKKRKQNGELKISEKRLRASEENFKTFFETIDDMIFIGSKNGEIFFTNSAVSRKLGYSVEELKGMHIIDVHPKEKKEEAEKIFTDMFAGEIDYCPLPLKRKDGTFLPVETRVWFGKWDEKECIFGISKDLSKEKENMEKFNKIFNNNPALMAISILPEIKFTEVNQALLNKLGYKKEEIIGKTAIELQLFVENEKQNKIKEELAEKGKINNIELKIRTKSGEIIQGIFSGEIIESGGKKYFLTVMIDITEQKIAEEKIKKSEEVLKMILDVTGEGIWEWDIKKNIVTHNRRWCKILGLDESNLVHSIEFFKNCLYEEDREEVLRKVSKAIIFGNQYESEHRIKDVKGKTVWIHDRGTVIERDERGEAIRMIGSIADITKRKESEEEIRSTTERLSLATRAGGIGIWDYDVVNNRLHWDEQMFNLYGIREENFSGAYDAWKKGLHPEDLERGNKEIEMALKGKKEFDTEFRVLWPDGKTVRNIRAMAVVIRDETGKPLHLIGTNWDITDIKIMEGKILTAKEQAESANRAKSEFLANMSHEIRTPMNAILGFSEILQDEISDRKSLDYINSIRTAGKNLLNLINDILDLSKIEAGKMDIHYEKIGILSILSEMRELFKMKSKEKGIEFYSEIDEKIPPVLTLDELRVKQILINLIGNAVKFTEKGFVKISVELLRKDTENSKVDICINVIDSGIGVAKGQQEKIFESFTQQDGQSTRKYGGTGLGLTISQKLAKMMGGEIKLDETVSEGSKFIVILKNITYFEEEKEGKKENKLLENIEYEFKKAKILIAEDVETNIEVVKGMLKKYKFEIFVSPDGIDAVNKAKKYHPDIILMDIQMPLMNGIDAATAIRSENTTKDIKIIALTASAMVEQEEKIEAVCDGYLKKPVKKIELLQELAKYIENKTISKESDTDSEIKIEILPDIKKIIKDKYYEEWKKIEKFILGDEVEEFAKKLKEESKEQNSKELQEYAEKLLNYAREFDIQKMEEQFKLFEKIIS